MRIIKAIPVIIFRRLNVGIVVSTSIHPTMVDDTIQIICATLGGTYKHDEVVLL